MHRRSGTANTAAALRGQFGTSTFTTAQAESIGVSARRLGIAQEAGLVTRMRRGLYVITTPGTTTPGTTTPGITSSGILTPAEADADHRALAHHLVSEFRGRGIAAAMGDETAASVWQLPHGPLVIPSLRVSRGSGAHIGVRHGVRVREGDTGDFVSFRGQIVTSPLATARDISRGLPRHQAVALFGLAQRRHAEWLLGGDECLDVGDLTQALADAQWRTELSQDMRRMLHDSARRQQWNASADPRPETYLEGISWGRFTGWRLGDMKPQEWVQGASGRRYRVDVLIDGVAGEADGAVKYGSRESLWKEKLRQEDIENGGTPVVRWTYAEAEHRPGLLRRRWRNALHRHAA